LEAIAAVDGLVATRLKRNFRLLAALAARDLVHFTRAVATAAAATGAASAATAAATAASGLTGRTAVWAAIRLILKAFAGEELLLSGAKNELSTAIGA